jgi:hypothetical protein
LLRENLAAAYGRSADYVVATAREIIDQAAAGSSEAPGQNAATALHRLDDAFRQYLAEGSATSTRLEEVGGLVAGAARVRRAAQSLSALGMMTGDDARLTRCGANLDNEIYALRSWYVTLGDSFLHSTVIPPPHVRDTEGRARLLECVRAAISDDGVHARSALVLLWANQHLDALWRLESHLGTLAAQASTSAEAEPA